MIALVALLSLLTDDSLPAACTVIAVFSFFGKWVMYLALRRSLHVEVHRRLLIACMLIPSVVFWSSGLLKEAVAMAGFGWVLLGTQHLLAKQFVRGAICAALGGLPVALSKPYVLVVFALAAAVWYYANRARHSPAASILSYPWRIAVGLGFAIGALIALGQLFPRYAVDTIGEQIAMQQQAFQHNVGGSTYVLGDPTQTTALGQLVFVPEALVAAFFRPFLFEANSPQILVNALETTVLSFILVRVVWKKRFAWVWGHLRASPVLMFFLAFSVIFGVAVGLSTANLGSLSRYRVPLVPFFAGIILILDTVATRQSQANSPGNGSVKNRLA